MKNFGIFFLIFLGLFSNTSFGQNSKLPYRDISIITDSLNEETILARMLDGLGFRYYWATENLQQNDLKFKASDKARSVLKTIDHILDLSEYIYMSILGKDRQKTKNNNLAFADKRQKTLENIKAASDALKNGFVKCKNIIIKIQNKDKIQNLPLWYLINGPIEDAIWHTGQIVLCRRATGNPIDNKVNFFNGSLKQ